MKKSSRSPAIQSPAETHQTTEDPDRSLTTNQGLIIADNQNSLRAGVRGRTLLDDFILREKITHFDHERIPERIVHARGSGAHGYFEVYHSQADVTKAAFLQEVGQRTEVFVRFSTVAGGAGSGDLPRDVRGFAVKFYTAEGNFDLVGNNIPVFFIQDAIKFPDLVHAVKMEPDRGFPQAATAHDTFWDFISLTPESMHMVLWIMSDRTIPRSLRMMEGFGVHTFRLVNAEGRTHFVKFHWRPILGSASVVWNEAVKINGADPDFHRRDLWESIEAGQFPEWELAFQVFDETVAAGLDFDVLDPTKLIPEEVVPLRLVGRLVLNRNPTNHFAETEQVAFCPANIVPGIDFSSDPLLQGRLFSYLDTQLSRLGGPNFHQLPVNAPKCPFHNLQRDGQHQMQIPKGRVNYEPNSLGPKSPRENPTLGFVSTPEATLGEVIRKRSETFADHYSQARLFYRSMTEIEQRHIAKALAFELGKVETVPIRCRMLGHLAIVDSTLHQEVEVALGMEGRSEPIQPAVPPRDLEPSPTLSLIRKARSTLAGRVVGVLLTDGFDAALLKAVRAAVMAQKARVALVAPKVGGVSDRAGRSIPVQHALAGGPSIFFDAVLVLASEEGAKALTQQPDALDWVRDAYRHLKVIGYTPAAGAVLEHAGIPLDQDREGLIRVEGPTELADFLSVASLGRVWERESRLEPAS